VGTSTGQAATIAACAALGGTVTPGNTIFPPDCTGSDSGTLLADMVSPFTYSTTAGTNTGTIESAVYQDADGGLDFYYQLTNDASSSTALARLTANSFLGFSTSLRRTHETNTVDPEAGPRRCAVCLVERSGARFASAKALEAHRRVMSWCRERPVGR
jgi:hypothetical protein